MTPKIYSNQRQWVHNFILISINPGQFGLSELLICRGGGLGGRVIKSFCEGSRCEGILADRFVNFINLLKCAIFYSWRRGYTSPTETSEGRLSNFEDLQVTASKCLRVSVMYLTHIWITIWVSRLLTFVSGKNSLLVLNLLVLVSNVYCLQAQY